MSDHGDFLVLGYGVEMAGTEGAMDEDEYPAEHCFHGNEFVALAFVTQCDFSALSLCELCDHIGR